MSVYGVMTLNKVGGKNQLVHNLGQSDEPIPLLAGIE